MWAVAVAAVVVLPTALAASGGVRGQAASAQSSPQPRQVPPADPSRAAALKSPTLDSQLVRLQQTATKKGAIAAVNSADDMGLSTAGTRACASSSRRATRSPPAPPSRPPAAPSRRPRATCSARGRPGDARAALAQQPGVDYVRPPFTPGGGRRDRRGRRRDERDRVADAGRGGAGVKVAIIDLGFPATRRAGRGRPARLADRRRRLRGRTSERRAMHGTAVAEIVHEMAPGRPALPDLRRRRGRPRARRGVRQGERHHDRQPLGRAGSTRAAATAAAAPGTPDAIVEDARANGDPLGQLGRQLRARQHWGGTLPTAPASRRRSGTSPTADELQRPGLDAAPATTALLSRSSGTTGRPRTQDYDLDLYDRPTRLSGRRLDNDQTAANAAADRGLLLPRTTPASASDFYLGDRNVPRDEQAATFDLFVAGRRHHLLQDRRRRASPSRRARRTRSPSARSAGRTTRSRRTARAARRSTGASKPDISGPDATSSADLRASVRRLRRLPGSPARPPRAPHVAGAAALVEGVHPTWTPGQVQSYLTGNAKDLGSSGEGQHVRLGRAAARPRRSRRSRASRRRPAAVGTTVTINGSNLLGTTLVDFDGATAVPTSVTATSLKAVVPDGAATGPVTITNADGAGSSATDFKVLPRVDSFDPAFDIRGHDVTIHGHSLAGATKVTFNGVSAAFTPGDDHTVTATIPPTGDDRQDRGHDPGRHRDERGELHGRAPADGHLVQPELGHARPDGDDRRHEPVARHRRDARLDGAGDHARQRHAAEGDDPGGRDDRHDHRHQRGRSQRDLADVQGAAARRFARPRPRHPDRPGRHPRPRASAARRR